jgi:16S rRNA (cytosine967-C5)-methyltransferase
VSLSVLEIAVEVVRAAGRAKPADQALREVLKAQRELPPFDAAAVARTVFAHYRWHGWTREERTVLGRLRAALRLADRFRGNPKNVPVPELRARAIPDWVATEMEVPDAWLLQMQQEPTLWLRAPRGSGPALAERLPGAELSELLPDALIFRGETDLFKSPEFQSGQFEIQDIASQVVGWCCAPQPGETWWDACAGEGGKLLHLSDLMQNKGLIWASDRAEWRLKMLKRRAARAKVFNYRSARWDGGAKLPTKTKFDGVLVDAPCSGLGTWQRNPHARWTTGPEEVRELAGRQAQLLRHAAPSVKPGGRLIYAVCTLTRAETTAVVAEFSVAHPEFEPAVMTLPDSGAGERVTSQSALSIWPQDLGGNGMFLAAWRRK